MWVIKANEAMLCVAADVPAVEENKQINRSGKEGTEDWNGLYSNST